MANTRRYGIQIGLIDNSNAINESAGINIQTQRTGHDNYAVLLAGVAGEGSIHNAIGWGSIDSPTTIQHLYMRAGSLWKNINGVETEIGGAGSGVSSLNSMTGDLSLQPVRGIVLDDGTPPNILFSTSSFDIFNQIAVVTVANTATETTLIGTGIGYNGGGSADLTLPVNFIAQGDVYRITARGIYGTKAATPGTLTIKIKFGTTVIVSTGMPTPTANATNEFWQLEADITCYTTGAGGTVMGNGAFSFTDGATANMNVFKMTNTSTVAIDTTATQAIGITAKWGTADTANTISLQTLVVEKLAPV